MGPQFRSRITCLFAERQSTHLFRKNLNVMSAYYRHEQQQKSRDNRSRSGFTLDTQNQDGAGETQSGSGEFEGQQRGEHIALMDLVYAAVGPDIYVINQREIVRLSICSNDGGGARVSDKP